MGGCRGGKTVDVDLSLDIDGLHRRRRRRVLMVALGLVVLLLGGCTSGDGDEALPAPEVTRFAEGALSDIPLPFGATPIGPRSEDEGVVTRTFGVEQQSPADVVRVWPADLIASGWDEVVPFTDAGRGVWRGEYVQDGRRLEAVVSRTPAIDNDLPDAAADGAQLSLVLHPDVTGVDAYTGTPDTTPEEGNEA